MSDSYKDEDPPIAQKLSRPSSDLDEILGLPFPVLDGGWVRVVDYMGNEAAIVQMARTSYGEGTKKIHEDIGLIRYLMRHNHTTPLEACEIKLHIRIPMDAWRQMVRHRAASYFTSMYDEPSVNEYSTRYSVAIDSQLKTDATKWRLQNKNNRQGSYGNLSAWPDNMDRSEFILAKSKGVTPGEYLSENETRLHDMVWEEYQRRLDLGVAREQARKDLPLSSMTEAYWKVDLHNLLHFLALRLDSHSQYEIRRYAEVIWDEIVSLWVPNVKTAFDSYHPLRKAKLLTEFEVSVISNAISHGRTMIDLTDLPDAWKPKTKRSGLTFNRECLEFIEKAKSLGFTFNF